LVMNQDLIIYPVKIYVLSSIALRDYFHNISPWNISPIGNMSILNEEERFMNIAL